MNKIPMDAKEILDVIFMDFVSKATSTSVTQPGFVYVFTLLSNPLPSAKISRNLTTFLLINKNKLHLRCLRL